MDFIKERDVHDLTVHESSTDYAIAKLLCERIADLNTDIDTRIVRPFNIYGPRMRYASKKHITDFIHSCLNDKDILLKSDGSPKRSFLYVKDAVEALFRIIIDGGAGETYNLSGETAVSIYELAQMFQKINPKIKIKRSHLSEKGDALRTSQNIISGNVDKLKSLGWAEHTELADGILRTVQWAKTEWI